MKKVDVFVSCICRFFSLFVSKKHLVFPIKVYIFILITFCLLISSMYAENHKNKCKLPYPDIKVKPADINFGNTYIGTSSYRTLQLTNEGCKDLIIQALLISEPAFSIIYDTCSGNTLYSGEICYVSLQFLPTMVESYTGTLSIYSNDPDENPLWLI